jgi:hypothetical protein
MALSGRIGPGSRIVPHENEIRQMTEPLRDAEDRTKSLVAVFSEIEQA